MDSKMTTKTEKKKKRQLRTKLGWEVNEQCLVNQFCLNFCFKFKSLNQEVAEIA